jgi:membrane protein insertase Oxa1/YidC/SpoIIIJ
MAKSWCCVWLLANHKCSRQRCPLASAPCCRPLLPCVSGFYWIPTLAGPVSLDNRGIEWLWPFVNGAPPIGWDDASHYLVLPVLLIICQYISSAIISPPIDPNAENANTQRALYTFLPLMVGWFALNVPSGGCGH